MKCSETVQGETQGWGRKLTFPIRMRIIYCWGFKSCFLFCVFAPYCLLFGKSNWKETTMDLIGSWEIIIVVLQAAFTGRYLCWRWGKAKWLTNVHFLKIKCYSAKWINSSGPFLTPVWTTGASLLCCWSWYYCAGIKEGLNLNPGKHTPLVSMGDFLACFFGVHWLGFFWFFQVGPGCFLIKKVSVGSVLLPCADFPPQLCHPQQQQQCLTSGCADWIIHLCTL